MEERITRNGFELYPQESRVIRLPFGKGQGCVDHGKEVLDWPALTYWFQKLNPYPLEDFIRISTPMAGRAPPNHDDGAWSFDTEGHQLLQMGLVVPHSRNRSQYAILFHLWLHGVLRNDAVRRVERWIRKAHSGFSETASRGAWKTIDGEIDRQAASIWTRYHRNRRIESEQSVPRRRRINRDGLALILKIAGCKIHLADFIFRLTTYIANHAGDERGVPVHSRVLTQFASRISYLDYLSVAEASGIIERGSAYLEQNESKRMKVPESFASRIFEDAEGDTSGYDIAEAIARVFMPEELATVLSDLRCDRRAVKGLMSILAKRTHKKQ